MVFLRKSSLILFWCVCFIFLLLWSVASADKMRKEVGRDMQEKIDNVSRQMYEKYIEKDDGLVTLLNTLQVFKAVYATTDVKEYVIDEIIYYIEEKLQQHTMLESLESKEEFDARLKANGIERGCRYKTTSLWTVTKHCGLIY